MPDISLQKGHVWPSGYRGASTIDFLLEIAERTQATKIQLATAYATTSGLKMLEKKFPAERMQYEWILGLDDYITQPAVLRRCMEVSGAGAKYFPAHRSGIRFHPKMFIFSGGSGASEVVVGSTNVTANGLLLNCELNVSIDCADAVFASKTLVAWDTMWGKASPITEGGITTYEEAYYKRKEARVNAKIDPEFRPRNSIDVLETDDSILLPFMAHTCWTDVGAATAVGRELELMKDLAPFFGLPSGHEPEVSKQFQLQNNTIVPLRFKRRGGNGMWRLTMGNSVPECAQGLFANGGGHSWAAVFTRVNGFTKYSLRFVRKSSTDYADCERKSKLGRSFGQTTARKFGWF